MSSSRLYFTTGQAAQQLSVSQAQIRSLCESGAVESVSTPGGQYRIAADELARLKREGLPPLARKLPDGSPPPARYGRARRGHPEQWAEPSGEAVSAADQVAITENLLRKRKIELELAEVEDQFRAREVAAEEREAERQHQECARLAENWVQEGEAYALTRIHPDVPAEMRLKAMQAVRDRLQPLSPAPSLPVTKEIADAVLELELGAWMRFGDLRAVVVEVRADLPWRIRHSSSADKWQTLSAKAATAAMIDLLNRDVHAPVSELRAAVKKPVQNIVDQFHHDERCQELLSRWSWLRLPDGTAEQQEQAKEAVEQALRAQPVNASDRDLELVRDASLQPFREATAQARAEQQAKQQADARQQQERSLRDSLERSLWVFPWDMPCAAQENARQAIRQALGKIHSGASEATLNQARDRAIQPYLDQHAEWKRKGKR